MLLLKDKQKEREKRPALPGVYQPGGLCLYLKMLSFAVWASVDGKSHLLSQLPLNLCLLGILHNTEGALRELGLSRSSLFIVPLNPDTNPLIHALLGRGICLLKIQRKP